jgi:hypothetical protein
MDRPRKRGFRLSYLLLLVPYAAMLFVPSYNRIEPALAGIPFFYWYQLMWIVLGVVILLPAFLVGERK